MHFDVLILFTAHLVYSSQEGAQKSIEAVKSRSVPPLAAEGGNESSLTGIGGSGTKELVSSVTTAKEQAAAVRTLAGSSQGITGGTTQHSKSDQTTN